MEDIQVRLAALEQERAAEKRTLRRWRMMTGALLAGALCVSPLVAQSEPKQGVPDQVAALQQQVAALKAALNQETAARQMGDAGLLAQVTPLAGKLEHVSVQQIDGYYSIVIDGANLHVRNGLGATNGNPAVPQASDGITNGLGNLIIGYNEFRHPGTGQPNDRNGSHNLVLGREQNFTSYGGLIAGRINNLSAPFATVTGGEYNTGSGWASSILGGQFNTASSAIAAVSGGLDNEASGPYSSITGGWQNKATTYGAHVSGGFGNTASGENASISGGVFNVASGQSASVSGGVSNRASGPLSSVSGGDANTASGDYSSVSGGKQRQAGNYWDWGAGGLFQDQ